MAELNISRKNISKLFSEMQNKKFIIPEYQRPYDWDLEKCETLWSDIVSFSEERNQGQEYFLGTIVTCKGEASSAEIEVIDGQQRITSLFLLLRAFYAKLEYMKEDDNIAGLKSQIGPCLWDVDPISMKVKEKSKIHLESRVSTVQDNELLNQILMSGTASEKSKSKYTDNYRYFYDKCEEYAKTNPLKWQALCVAILQSCIVLPIDCEKEDTALTIFNTLNDRGLPLSDSDIFKAQMYKSKSSSDRPKFASDWKDLRERCDTAKIKLDDLFRYYSHYIRAKNKDKTKEIGLRKFYAENKYQKLQDPNFLESIGALCDFWSHLNNFHVNSDLKISMDTLKYIHCLHNYPNEFWEYLVSVYFIKNKSSENFEKDFISFLKKTISFLFLKFIEKPTVNAIKDDVYQGLIDIYLTGDVQFKTSMPTDLNEAMEKSCDNKISRALVLLHAYLNEQQESLLPQDFEVEHIFPLKWQDTNYNGWSQEEAEVHIERFGNKSAIEKKLNIQAGNGYFGKKKGKYKNSKIQDILDISSYENKDWQKEDIELRNKQFISRIKDFFIANTTGV